MSTHSPNSPDTPAWEQEIRAREEETRVAFLAADLAALDKLWADSFVVNSPFNKIVTKKDVFEALRTGRLRHLAFAFEIEHLSRAGDLVVVMGRDRVEDPPDKTISHRRYTNIWQWTGDAWRTTARHANVISREAAG